MIRLYDYLPSGNRYKVRLLTPFQSEKPCRWPGFYSSHPTSSRQIRPSVV
jgi:hypothetical protein